jgi:hypothetical protein
VIYLGGRGGEGRGGAMAWRGMAWHEHEHEHEHGIKEEQIIRHPTRLCVTKLC